MILISCKKSDHSIWAALTREINERDPNAKWEPVNIWTNHKPLTYITGRKEWPAEYYKAVADAGVSVLNKPSTEIFAFQEMAKPEPSAKGGAGKKSGKPQGDSNIFNSIMSLMKAQAYELAIRGENTKKRPTIYQFNLVSLCETELVELYFNEDNITPTEIDEIAYVGRYILKRREIFSRITFVRAEAFENLLEGYNALHKTNIKILKSNEDDFYKNILTDSPRYSLLLEEFSKSLRNRLFLTALRKLKSTAFKFEIGGFQEDPDGNGIQICVAADDINLNFLNTDEGIEAASSILKTLYRYSGPISFVDNIPF